MDTKSLRLGRACAQTTFSLQRLQRMKFFGRYARVARGGFPYNRRTVAELQPHATNRGRPKPAEYGYDAGH